MTPDEVQNAIFKFMKGLHVRGATDEDLFLGMMFTIVSTVLRGAHFDIDKTHWYLSNAISKDMISAAKDDMLRVYEQGKELRHER